MLDTPTAAIPPAAIELRGKLETLLTLALGSTEPTELRAALAAKLSQAPGFFDSAPVILDLAALKGTALDAPALLALVREHRLLPVGARHGDAAQMAALAAAGVPALRASTGAARAEPASRPATSEAQADASPAHSVPTVIARPVRSGQQIYARGGDLVLLGSASPGCELIADGSIHVYGALRGRALCGVSGNTAARIFCQNLAAELVSVAGHYKLLDELPEALRGQSAQVWLDGEQLHIQPI